MQLGIMLFRNDDSNATAYKEFGVKIISGYDGGVTFYWDTMYV